MEEEESTSIGFRLHIGSIFTLSEIQIMYETKVRFNSLFIYIGLEKGQMVSDKQQTA